MDGNEKAVTDSASDHGSGQASRQRYSNRRSIDAESQRARLLAYLIERGSVSTLEARGRALRIMSPAARVLELREDGHPIVTTWDQRQGCARYRLAGGGGHGSDE